MEVTYGNGLQEKNGSILIGGEGEPNDSSNVISNENRVAVWPKKWNDLNDESGEQSGYICEWEMKPAENNGNIKAAPAKVVFKSCKNIKSKKISLSWKKVKDAKGYEIMYANNNKWKGKKSISTKKTTYTLKNLKKKKTYHIRVRAYKMDGNKKVYGSWSKVKKVSVKK